MDCLVPATQKGRRRGVCRQDLAGECALQQVTASGFQACSPVHQSLHAASSSYQRKAARRQAWDNRVYHHPSFTSPKSRTQPRHAHRGRTQAHGTGVSGCWPGADAEAVWGCCSQAAIEELELVSLLQDISDCWSPEGWFPTTSSARCRSTQKLLQASKQSPRRTDKACQKHENSIAEPGPTMLDSPVQTSGHTSHQLAPIRPSMACLLPDSNRFDSQWHADISKTASVQSSAALQELRALTGTYSEAAAASATASNSANDAQEEAAPEADAAAMAAWLIQKPSLLEGILGHLESFAATAAEASSTSCDVSTSLHAADLARQSYCLAAPDTESPHGKANTTQTNQFLRPAEADEQPLLLGVPADRDDDQLHQQIHTISLPSQSTVHPRLSHGQQAQTAVQDSSAVQAYARPQLSKHAGGEVTLSLMDSGPVEQKAEVDAGQLPCSAGQQQQGTDAQTADAQAAASGCRQGQPEGNLSGASCPEPLMSRLLLEHCAAGRYDEARAMLKEGASADTSDAEGNTLLMLACREGHGRLVKLMVRKGARLDACNVQHKSAEQLASDNNRGGIVKFLQEASRVVPRMLH